MMRQRGLNERFVTANHGGVLVGTICLIEFADSADCEGATDPHRQIQGVSLRGQGTLSPPAAGRLADLVTIHGLWDSPLPIRQ